MDCENCFLYKELCYTLKTVHLEKLSLYLHKRKLRMWVINNNVINHKLLELSVQAPRVQL